MLPPSHLQRDLPLIPDHILLQARRAYHVALAELGSPGRPESRKQLARLEDSVRRIDQELQARGIGNAPWWASAEATSRDIFHR